MQKVKKKRKRERQESKTGRKEQRGTKMVGGKKEMKERVRKRGKGMNDKREEK